MIAATLDDNYERIKTDLVGLGLTYDRLIDDVLDHVCCLVEEYMDSGHDFESSYRLVLQSIGDKRLPEIQHQTFLNLDKKYQRMKNFTYIFGLSSALLTIIGALFKKMHWPGASILVTVGIVLVVLVFLPLYFITKQREQVEKKNPIYAIVGFLTIALLLAGALFKLSHWPGAGLILQLGTGLLVVGFIPLYVVNVFQRDGGEKVTLPYVAMLLVGISLVMIYSSVNMGKYMLDIYMDEAIIIEEQAAETQKGTSELIEWAGESCDASCLQTISSIHADARSIQVKITSMQEDMKTFLEQPGVSLAEIKGKDSHGAGREVIIDSGNGHDFAVAALEFRIMLEEVIKDPVALAQIIDHLEFTGKVGSGEYGVRDVEDDPFMRTYYKLSNASRGIALAEYVAISRLLHP